MIFVSVGTTKFGFERLLKAIDEILFMTESEEELVVQSGSQIYSFRYKHAKTTGEIGFDEMIAHIKKARILITHGGPATIFQGLEYGKNLPLVVPRSGDIGEHVNNHQIMFVKRLVADNKVVAVFSEEDLKGRIRDYLAHPVANIKTKREVNKQLIQYLDDFTKQVGGGY